MRKRSGIKHAGAAELGRLGGLKGGKARMAALSPERRSELARQAAEARWGNARPARRTRASGERTRANILAAAREQLVAGGPERIRLQEVAAAAGVSHSTVLHHFRSRAGLLDALTEHMFEGAQQAMIRAFLSGRDPAARSVRERHQRTLAMVEALTEAFERGYARLMASAILSGRGWRGQGGLRSYLEIVHAERAKRSRRESGPIPAFEDTLYGGMLVLLCCFGGGLFNDAAWAFVGLPADRETQRGFRAWFAELIETMSPILVASKSEAE